MPITPLNKDASESIQAKIDTKTKPLGALGALEPLALQLALITKQRLSNKLVLSNQNNNQNNSQNSNQALSHTANVKVSPKPTPEQSQISISHPAMLVFAGDHGINQKGVSIAPSAVTKQMVQNFLHGGAAINCFCQSNDISLSVVDCGILETLSNEELPSALNKLNSNGKEVQFFEQRLGAGTNDLSIEPAMSIAQVNQGFEQAKQLIDEKVAQGVELFLLGEMGIANTSSAAALMSALTSFSVEECVGRGTGISDEQLDKKTSLIKQALARISLINNEPSKKSEQQSSKLSEAEVLTLLAELGGFEIVQMVSAILSAAALSIPVVIDGFIVSVAALVAFRLDNNIANYLIFSHISKEKAHQVLLDELMSAQTFSTSNTQPLLDLGLRLGEGTGAALSLPLIKAAASFYNNMASFDSAGVTV